MFFRDLQWSSSTRVAVAATASASSTARAMVVRGNFVVALGLRVRVATLARTQRRYTYRLGWAFSRPV
jgi:hypothetical protein